jgi:uncharacterized damage-inducible protein DinB
MKEIIGKLLLYNHWCNEELCIWLRSLEASLLKADVASSFPSILRTLQHMCNAQHFWLAVVTESVYAGDSEFSDADDAMDALEKGSLEMITQCIILDDKALENIVHSPEVMASKYDFLLHIINHNTYHRGQIVSIARFLGVVDNIPNTDYEAYLWSLGRKA